MSKKMDQLFKCLDNIRWMVYIIALVSVYRVITEFGKLVIDWMWL